MSPAKARARGVAGLPARQVEVLRLVAADVPRKEIARRLGISAKTVELHLYAACRGLGVLTIAAACHVLGREDDRT